MSYWVTITGEGSFSLGPNSRIFRGPHSYELTAEQAAEILAERDAGRLGDHVLVSTVDPNRDEPPPTGVLTMSDFDPDLDQYGKPSWMLRPSDFAGYKPDTQEPDLASTDADYEPQVEPDDFPCDHCGAGFTSSAGLAQHTMLRHGDIHRQAEDEVRAQLEAERQRKALAERIREADPKELRPEERGPD